MACAYGENGDYDKAIADCTRGHPAEPENMPSLQQPWSRHGHKVANSTRRSQTSPTPSASTRKTPWRTTAAVLPTKTRANTTKRSWTTRRPSALDPNDPAAYFERGAAYGDKREFDKEIADYTEVIRLAPADAPMPITTGPSPTSTRAKATRPLPTSQRSSDWTPTTPTPITTAANPTGRKATRPKRMPISSRPGNWGEKTRRVRVA